MSRPRRFRRVRFQPGVTYFKPRGVETRNLEESVITIDEIEAIRLKDYEGLDQEKSAKKMNISQPTFHRLLLSTRKKIADALVNGKALKIEGGVYKMVRLGRGQGAGRGGRGRQSGGFGLGPAGQCVCPKCGKVVTHTIGTPCFEMMCSDCKTKMTRKG